MSWFKIDDGFHAHPKVKSIPRRDRAAAIGLWTMAGSWCSQQLTDGHVPEYMVEEFGASPKLASALVAATLWTVNDAKGGWDFHDWQSHQPSRDEVQSKRKRNTERIAAWRAGKTTERNAVTEELHNQSNAVTDVLVTQPHVTQPPTRPDPTVVPTELQKGRPRNERGTRIPRDFTVTTSMRQWADENVPGMDIDFTTQKFILHFQAQSGQRGTMLSWEAAWKKWMLGDYKPQTVNGQQHYFGLPGQRKSMF